MLSAEQLESSACFEASKRQRFLCCFEASKQRRDGSCCEVTSKFNRCYEPIVTNCTQKLIAHMTERGAVATSERKFIGMTKLRERWNDCSHMFIERKIKSDLRFPRVYRIGRRRLFALDEIEAYERLSIAPR